MRKLVWFALGFAIASAVGAYCYAPWLAVGVVVFVLLAAVFFALSEFWQPFRIGCIILVGAAVGLLWFGCYDSLFLNEARDVDGVTRSVTIQASDYSYATDYGSAVEGEVTLNGKSYRVKAYLNKDWELEPGDSVTGMFRFRLTTSGGSEEPVYHQGNGVFLLAYQRDDSISVRYGKPEGKDAPALWRSKLIDRINEAFPDDTEGFARALLLGERTGIDYTLETAFRLSGISHIIAVSGLHVSILFGLVYLLLGKRRVLIALIGIPLLFLFAAIAGFTPSITRSCIMQSVLILAMLFGKEYDQLSSLAFAALVMLVVNPLVITSVSFQLSAGCMLGIFLYGERLRQWLMDEKRLGQWKGKFTNWLSSSLSITLSAMVFTTPLVAIYFGAVSIIGIVTNLLTLWVITYIFYGILLVCAVGSFSAGIAAFLGGVSAWPIRYVLSAAEVFAAFPLAAVYTKSIYVVLWLVLTYVLLFVYLHSQKKPALLFTALVAGGLIASMVLSWAEPLIGECRMTVLDVGQGQAILLQSQGKTFLVDCGADNCEDAADITADTLLSQGIRQLDGIFVTHYDKDHAGGLEYLLSRVKAENLFLPYALDENGVGNTLTKLCDGQVHMIMEDMEIRYGDVAITVFAPVSYNSGNESSMCILFQTKNCDILITGDSGKTVETMLLQHHTLPKLEVLVAGHHGSKNSTSQELLEATQPEYVFISASQDNPYGHPAEELLTRLKAFGCVIYRTDQNGTIHFRR